MTLPRLLLVALVLTALCAVGGVAAQVLARRAEPQLVEAVPAGVRQQGRADAAALAVLRDWDVRRARAWARGDAAALRALYVPGSVAGRRDVAMLRAWTRRAMVVRGLRMQVLHARVRDHAADRLVLDVTDRVARAVAVGPGLRRTLPRDAPSTRTVELVRVAGRWRVAAVRAPQPAPQPAR